MAGQSVTAVPVYTPYLVRWPGKIEAGAVSDHLLYYPDVMPTLAKLTHSDCPPTDGLSFLPSLLNQTGQQQHDYLYWEYTNQTAVRMKDWKAYRGKSGKWELYDLAEDIGENHDLAAENPQILAQLQAYAKEAHEPIRPGEIYDRELVTRDHSQTPHARNVKK